MTTATELIARSDCEDMRRELYATQIVNRNLTATVARLNALVRERDAEIAQRAAETARLKAELAEARAFVLDAQQLGF